ncbi:MAG: SixA phosphatase family protein [Alphaproteobacteria bacterium]
MPQLLLLRHAKSSWASPGISDHERALTERGSADATRLGTYLAAQNLTPDLILTSPARRTRQTVDLLLGAFATHPPVLALDELYNASLANLFAAIRAKGAGASLLLVVGHNPSIAQAANQLCAGQTGAASMACHEKYPTAALAHFDTGSTSLADLAAPTPLVSFHTPNDYY